MSAPTFWWSFLSLAPGGAAQVAVPAPPKTSKQAHEQNNDGGYDAASNQNRIKHIVLAIAGLTYNQPQIGCTKTKTGDPG